MCKQEKDFIETDRKNYFVCKTCGMRTSFNNFMLKNNLNGYFFEEKKDQRELFAIKKEEKG
jgi:hypothetical protein